MRTILKFPLTTDPTQTVELGFGATILSVQFEGGGPLTLWASLDPDETTEGRAIRLYGTGETLDTVAGVYLATVRRGAIEWHVYDAGPVAGEVAP